MADSLSGIFGKTKFDLIVALNILEIIEPLEFLSKISKQIKKGFFVISDPYDFDRGINSVKNPLDEQTLRTKITDSGFKITPKTKKPSHHLWNLKLKHLQLTICH